MSQTSILLACPTCKQTCRTQREIRTGAKMRCPGCNGKFYFFVHGNGAVELRPVDDEPVADEPAAESRLPPRLAEQGETQGTRRILTSRRRNRAIGGYLAFEKSRSYIGTFALWTVLGLGSLAGHWYFTQINTISKAQGRKGSNAMNSDIDVKRKEYLERQKRALEKLNKKQSTSSQPAGAKAKVEDGKRPGNQTPD
jgi:hypothetical protein